MARRTFHPLLLAAVAVSLLFLGSATASPSSTKRIAYVSGGEIFTIAASGTGTADLNVTGTNPSQTTDGSLIYYENAGIRRVDASGAGDTAICPGSDPAISPRGTRVAYVLGGSVTVADPADGADGGTDCDSPVSLGSGSEPAWSPDSEQIVFILGGDVAVAPAAGGAPQKLGTTSATESHPSWSPDGTKIAYISGDAAAAELFVMNADGTGRQQLTSNGVQETSPSWAPASDEIVYAAGGNLYAIAAGGTVIRQLADATAASSPDWGLAVANLEPPTITLDPTSGGVAADGTVFSADQGSWTSISGITGFSFQWKRCGSSGGGCVSIDGATDSTYTATSADIGSTIRVVVTATTPDGSAPGTSSPTGAVVAAAPKNVTPPTITGTPILGGTVTATTGTWTGSSIVYTYLWLRCDTAGANCAAVTSESSQNVYSPVSDDVGKTLKVRVRATNAQCSGTPAGCPTADSIASPPVSSNIPANSTLPVITEVVGTTGVVVSYTATTGTWTGAGTLTYRYQWRRCDSSGANCRDIAGATLTTYTPAAADIGGKLRVAVTATNTYGSTTAISEPSELLAGQAPANTIRPSISGTERAGSVLFATTGTWTGSLPLTYTYQWQRCNASGASCANIAGATSSSYIATASDVGSRLAVAVTARNSSGAATVSSLPTDVIEAATTPTPTPATRPTNTRAPSVRGTLARGKTLTAVVGTWSGTTPMTYSYQWQRCPRRTTACVNVPLATRGTYTLGKADVGKRIRLLVTAANAAGATQAASSISKVVAAKAPARKKTSFGRINGNAKANRLVGTARAERIDGKAGNDRIDGKGGKDLLLGGFGNDTIVSLDGRVDVVDCGPGRDVVVADRTDRVNKNCERVTRRTFKKK